MSESKERQAAWRERMKERGFEQVPVWVPADCRELIRDIARKMREGAERRRKKEVSDKRD